MNVILIPALLLLIGLVVYKKVIEPRRATGGAARERREPKPDKKAAKARAVSSGSGRMGSVL